MGTCPDCGAEVRPKGLGPHRRLVHNYRKAATAPAALVRRLEVLEARVDALEELAQQRGG